MKTIFCIAVGFFKFGYEKSVLCAVLVNYGFIPYGSKYLEYLTQILNKFNWFSCMICYKGFDFFFLHCLQTMFR